MKAGIHPKYNETQVVCACGNMFTTRSTRQNLRTDLCNVCHPFYTGEQRIVDTAGQVERFMKRMGQAAADTRPSKRQLRLTARTEKLEAERKRAEEAAAAAAAEEAAVRAAARAAALEAAAAEISELEGASAVAEPEAEAAPADEA